MQGLAFHPYYAAVVNKYAQLPLKPLKITAKIINGVVTGVDNKIHLDSMLAWAVSKIYGSPEETAIIPLPLQCAWVSESGLPLWVSTPFEMKDAHSSFMYWHKRFPQYQVIKFCSKPNTSTSSGRHKEYRVPMSVTITEDGLMVAYCIGNTEEIALLLEAISGVGKKSGSGYGAINYWEIEEIKSNTLNVSNEFMPYFTEEILKKRPVPIEYFIEVPKEARMSLRSGWTPPYWDKKNHGKVILSYDK